MSVCKTCGYPIKPYETDAELQKAKETFMAERDFLAPKDNYEYRRAIYLLDLKLSIEKNGFCSSECGAEDDKQQEEFAISHKGSTEGKL